MPPVTCRAWSSRSAALDERDVEGYLAYLGYVARLHRVTGPAFIYGAPPTWRTVTQVAPADALRLEPWLTMDAAIRRYRALAASAPTAGPVRHLCRRQPLPRAGHAERDRARRAERGHLVPAGGIYAIAAALERLARELGVEIRTSCRAVSRIEVPARPAAAPASSWPTEAGSRPTQCCPTWTWRTP